MTLSFGSLDAHLKRSAEGMALLQSAGPVSDAFILSNGPRDLLNGPVGSGKTTAAIKRMLRRAIQMPPMLHERDPQGRPVRRYRVSLWRETYAQLWGTTIKSWQKIFHPEKGFPDWQGASPRSAIHRITFEDGWGPIHFEAMFFAFGDDADPDDLGGTEYTDAYLNEQDQLREALHTNLARSVGRFPNRGEIGLPDDERIIHGHIFGDCNAPAPDNWTYKNWFSFEKPPGNALFRQPGGMHAEAENLKAVGRGYYRQMMADNANKPWWVKIKIHNEPGFNREEAIVYPDYIDSEMCSHEPLAVHVEIPVIIAIDGGATPAAGFVQELANTQLRCLHEIALDRGDEITLGEQIARVMALPRFKGCEFYLTGDEATFAGDDLPNGSWIARLGKIIGLKPNRPSLGNHDKEGRHFPFRDAMKRRVGANEPAFLVDGRNCPVFRRGLNGTFKYHVSKFGERCSIVKNLDSHVCEAFEYAGGETGKSHARKRKNDRLAERAQKRAEAGRTPSPRYNPLSRKRA
ncbi:MAG: hypothetical protein ACRDBL_11260 [Rhabdaerophilum sp.]